MRPVILLIPNKQNCTYFRTRRSLMFALLFFAFFLLLFVLPVVSQTCYCMNFMERVNGFADESCGMWRWSTLGFSAETNGKAFYPPTPDAVTMRPDMANAPGAHMSRVFRMNSDLLGNPNTFLRVSMNLTRSVADVAFELPSPTVFLLLELRQYDIVGPWLSFSDRVAFPAGSGSALKASEQRVDQLLSELVGPKATDQLSDTWWEIRVSAQSSNPAQLYYKLESVKISFFSWNGMTGRNFSCPRPQSTASALPLPGCVNGLERHVPMSPSSVSIWDVIASGDSAALSSYSLDVDQAPPFFSLSGDGGGWPLSDDNLNGIAVRLRFLQRRQVTQGGDRMMFHGMTRDLLNNISLPSYSEAGHTFTVFPFRHLQSSDFQLYSRMRFTDKVVQSVIQDYVGPSFVWRDFVISWDQISQTLTHYLDGVLVKSEIIGSGFTKLNLTFFDILPSVYFGSQGPLTTDNMPRNMDGELDSISFYARPVSTTEVLAMRGGACAIATTKACPIDPLQTSQGLVESVLAPISNNAMTVCFEFALTSLPPLGVDNPIAVIWDPSDSWPNPPDLYDPLPLVALVFSIRSDLYVKLHTVDDWDSIWGGTNIYFKPDRRYGPLELGKRYMICAAFGGNDATQIYLNGENMYTIPYLGKISLQVSSIALSLRGRDTSHPLVFGTSVLIDGILNQDQVINMYNQRCSDIPITQMDLSIQNVTAGTTNDVGTNTVAQPSTSANDNGGGSTNGSISNTVDLMVLATREPSGANNDTPFYIALVAVGLIVGLFGGVFAAYVMKRRSAKQGAAAIDNLSNQPSLVGGGGGEYGQLALKSRSRSRSRSSRNRSRAGSRSLSSTSKSCHTGPQPSMDYGLISSTLQQSPANAYDAANQPIAGFSSQYSTANVPSQYGSPTMATTAEYHRPEPMDIVSAKHYN